MRPSSELLAPHSAILTIVQALDPDTHNPLAPLARLIATIIPAIINVLSTTIEPHPNKIVIQLYALYAKIWADPAIISCQIVAYSTPMIKDGSHAHA